MSIFDSFHLLLFLGLIVFILVLIWSTVWRLVYPIISFFASFVYAAFFSLEGYYKIKFNLPKEGGKRRAMDFIACISFSFLLLLVVVVCETIIQAPGNNLISIAHTIPSTLIYVPSVGLLSIYFISKSISPVDNDKDGFDKLNDLGSLKGGFKKLLP